jgi:hypothetical protein
MTQDLFDRRERVFQLWAYTVGMSRLLLRSTKSDTFQTRVEVMFQNVKAIQLPTVLEGLVVAEADRDLAQRIEVETGLTCDEGSRFFGLRTSHGTGYVVAGAMVSDEDEGEYFEPSKLWPDVPKV